MSALVDVELMPSAAVVDVAALQRKAEAAEQAAAAAAPASAASSAACPAPSASPPVSASSSAYLRFLARLHAAWPDAPRLTVSAANLSVLFPRPMHLQPSERNAMTDPSAPRLVGGAATRRVPNLASTLAHWAGLPVRLAADQLGFGAAPLKALNEVHAHIQPGTMTLVLAPPGGGKSTLLKAFSGRLPPSSVHGSLLFNGSTSAELSARGVHLDRLAAYVGQLDLHFPTLTVSETLRFAAASSVPSASLLPPAALAADPELESLEAQRGDMLISLLGLDESKDVIVGNEMLRGVSGGQKKRVTIGEMLVGNARLLALDEVSTGLDAAVTTMLFSSLKELCSISGKSVVASLLQPTPETYATFDQIILLHAGRVMYAGPRSDVKRWLWQVCGVDVPLDVDEASFLVDFLTNPTSAIDAAKINAQAHSFVEATRKDRQADAQAEEQVQRAVEAANKGAADAAAALAAAAAQLHPKAAQPGPPAAHPDLYESYATYAGIAEEEPSPQDSPAPVRVHFAVGEAEHTTAVQPTKKQHKQLGQADSAEDSNNSNSAQEQPGASASPPVDDGSSLLDCAASPLLRSPVESSAVVGSSALLAPPSSSVGGVKRLGRRPMHSTAGALPVSDLSHIHARYLKSKWHAHVQTAHSLTLQSSEDCPSLDPTVWSAYTRANFSSAHPHPSSVHLRLCFGRQWLLFKRNVSVLLPRLAKALLIGLLYGLLFFRLRPSDFMEKLAVAMYGALFAAMTNLSELPVASEARNVIAKQIDAGFFPATPYYAGVLCMHLPLTILESTVYGTFIYWISNMAPDAGRFFFYLLVCFVASNAMATFYRFVSYITPNPDVAKQLDLPFVVLFIILNAFIIVFSKIPLWLRSWAFWIAPLSWGTKSLALNEFNGAEYSGPSPHDPSITLGQYYLDEFELPTEFIWKWMGIVYLVGWFIVWSIVCCFFLSRLRVITPLGSEREQYEEADMAALKKRHRKLSAQEEAAAATAALCAADVAVHDLLAAPTSAADVVLDIDAPASAAASPSSKRAGGGFQLSALPFTPATLAWSSLNYSVPLPDGSGGQRVLLSNVSGFSLPGTMTALMGASGAGKTTLMDCIAGRKTTGTLSATVQVNGVTVDIHSSSFQRACGYVEQSDLHIGTATVEEALRFSAKLRLPCSVSPAAQHTFVTEVMQLLGLTPFRHSIIGDAAIAGLAPAQLKLVTIGCELVANPAILFLDEPTSGLDAPSAWRVMTAIKRIALTGRTVLCTIHQPASRLFFLFDRLLLLQPGGRTVYFDALGLRGELLVSYFEAAVQFQQTLPLDANPANWILDLLADPLSPCKDWNAHWNNSRANVERVTPMLLQAQQPPAAKAAAVDSSSSAAAEVYPSWWSRYASVQGRLFVSYWRNGPMNLTRAAVVLVIGFLIGLLYYRVRPTDYAGLNSFLAGVFMSLGFGPSLPASAALPTFFRQRAVVYRETTVGCYSIFAHALGLTVCEALSMSVLMMIYILPLYFLMGLAPNAHQFWRYYLVLYCCSQLYASLSQLYLALLPNQVSASVVHSILFSFLFVFGGLLVTAQKMPAGWRWWYAMIPTPKAYVAVALGQLSCRPDDAVFGEGFGCGYIHTPTDTEPVQVYDYASALMQNSDSTYGNQIGWLILIIAVLKVATLLSFKFVSHLKR